MTIAMIFVDCLICVSRLRAKIPEKRANFNSNAADRLWGGGAPASNSWGSGSGELVAHICGCNIRSSPAGRNAPKDTRPW